MAESSERDAGWVGGSVGWDIGAPEGWPRARAWADGYPSGRAGILRAPLRIPLSLEPGTLSIFCAAQSGVVRGTLVLAAGSLASGFLAFASRGALNLLSSACNLFCFGSKKGCLVTQARFELSSSCHSSRVLGLLVCAPSCSWDQSAAPQHCGGSSLLERLGSFFLRIQVYFFPERSFVALIREESGSYKIIA